ncbi:MAG: flagellar motor switch protein FliM [Alphaproteobacteria bacterium]
MSIDDVDQDDMAAAWGAEEGDDDDAADAAEGGGGDGDGGDEDMDEQDAMAAAWGAEMGDEDGGGDGDDQDAMAAAWGAEMDDETPPGMVIGSPGAADRVLNQDEIDNLLGFDPNEGKDGESRGIRALINSALVSYERLPMLEIIFDRLVRLMTTSLRNFTSDNVEVSLDSISSIRFGDYLNSIPLPAILAVFKAREWDNFGLFTIESNLIYSVVDVLLGGRRGTQMMRIEGRPYTTIELGLLERMVEVILRDAEAAFEPISKVAFDLDRLETNPRFAAITRSANASILVRLRIDMEDRGGRIELMLPYATVEPIRELLLQGFMGERFGRDSIWEGHLATELWSTKVRLDAVLDEFKMPLNEVMDFKVGQTIMLDKNPEEPVQIRCGNISLTEGKLGRIEDRMAVRLDRSISSRKVPISLQPEGDEEVQKIEAA